MTNNKLKMGSLDDVLRVKQLLNNWGECEEKEIDGVIYRKNDIRKAVAFFYILQIPLDQKISKIEEIVLRSLEINATHYDVDLDKYYRKGEYKWQLWYSNGWMNIINEKPVGKIISISNFRNAIQVLSESENVSS